MAPQAPAHRRRAAGRPLSRILVALAAACALAIPLAAFATDGETGMPADSAKASSAYDEAGIADANRHQLVLVVRFAGDTIGDGDTGLNRPGYGDGTEWSYQLGTVLNGVPAGKAASPTLYSYLKEVSDGQVRLKTVSPQTDEATGRVAYLSLAHARSYYEGLGSGGAGVMAADAVAAFNAAYGTFDVSIFGVGGGNAGNVLIIPDVGSSSPKDGTSPFWPRRFDIGSEVYLTGGGSRLRTGSFTVVDTSHLLGAGTIIHETMHAFGARDLYRAGSFVESTGGKPVGVWDIMAQHAGSTLMRPLAISRADCGWTAIEEVGSGTHTLYAPGLGKRQAVMFKSPLSDSEYFVAEFRRANTDITDLSALDTSNSGRPSTIGGSGLIVYRVNPPMKDTGNKGAKDYVYLFRPGETTAADGVRGDGAGDVRNAQLSASGRTSLGTTDMTKGLADGAITYSDGQNSGLVVRVKSQADDSISFEIAYPDYDAAGVWMPATSADGSCPLPAAGVLSAKTASDGSRAYVLVQEGTLANSTTRVYAYDGTAWTGLGVAGQNLTPTGICALGGKVYVLLTDHENVIVKVWSGSAWSEAARVSAPENTSPALGVIGGKVHVFADRSGGRSRLYALEGSSLRAVAGSAPCAYPMNAALADVGGKPAVIGTDYVGVDSKTGAWVLENGVWALRAQWGQTATSVSVASDGGVSYVLLIGQGASAVMSLSPAGATTPVDVSSALPSAMAGSLAIHGTELYAAVTEAGASTPVRVLHAPVADLTRWSSLGERVAANASDAGLVIVGDTVYCAPYDTASGTASLRRYQTVPPTVTWKLATPPTVQAGLTYNGVAQTGLRGGAGWKVLSGRTSAAAAGSYPVEVGPADGYAWTTGGDRTPRSFRWTIAPASIAGATIGSIPAQTATGEPLTPAVTVTVGKRKLVAGTDYTVDYKNNVGAGTATVIVTGKGNYAGSRTASFQIKAPTVTPPVKPTDPDKPTGPTTPGTPQMPACAPGWQLSGGTWYYGTPAGVRATGWVASGGAWYYLDPSTGAMRTGWVNDRGTWYYLHGSGAMATGWLNLGGTWYYLEGSGAMATGWRRLGGTWYYLYGSGAMAVGWANAGGTWYYLHGSGAMATGWLRTGGAWYFLHGSGAMATGWLNLGGTWYYLYGSGAMAANTWVGDYYLTGSGAMATNTWIGPWRVGADGRWIR